MRRAGHSMVELMVVMGMTSVVFTIGVGTVHRVMHQQRTYDREESVQLVADRLARQFRADVRRAEHHELGPMEDGRQQLALKQRTNIEVTYVVRGHQVERASIEPNATPHRDRFSFIENYRTEFRRDGDRLSCTVIAPPEGEQPAADAGRIAMHVEATVARDYRFSRTRTASE